MKRILSLILLLNSFNYQPLCSMNWPDGDSTPPLLSPISPIAHASLRDVATELTLTLDLDEDTRQQPLVSVNLEPASSTEAILSPDSLFLATKTYNKKSLQNFTSQEDILYVRYAHNRTIIHKLVELLSLKSERSQTNDKQAQKKRRKLYSSLRYILEQQQGKKLLEEKDENQQTPLHRAVINNYLKVAELLLGAGACVSTEDASGYTPFHYAALNYKTRMATLLLLHGAEVNAGQTPGKTPLATLFKQELPRPKTYKNIFELLLNAGAITKTNSTIQTLLHQVLDTKDITTLTILLRRGLLKELESQGENGSGVVHYVLSLIEHLQAVKEWNDKYWGFKNPSTGSFTNKNYEPAQNRVERELSALHKCLKLVIKYDAQGDILHHQATPLIRVIESKLFDLIILLAKNYPLTVQIADSEGNIPLHLLIKEYSNQQKTTENTTGNTSEKTEIVYEAIKYLAARSERNTANNKGLTPLQLAQELKLDTLQELLKN